MAGRTIEMDVKKQIGILQCPGYGMKMMTNYFNSSFVTSFFKKRFKKLDLYTN